MIRFGHRGSLSVEIGLSKGEACYAGARCDILLFMALLHDQPRYIADPFLDRSLEEGSSLTPTHPERGATSPPLTRARSQSDSDAQEKHHQLAIYAQSKRTRSAGPFTLDSQHIGRRVTSAGSHERQLRGHAAHEGTILSVHDSVICEFPYPTRVVVARSVQAGAMELRHGGRLVVCTVWTELAAVRSVRLYS